MSAVTVCGLYGSISVLHSIKMVFKNYDGISHARWSTFPQDCYENWDIDILGSFRRQNVTKLCSDHLGPFRKQTEGERGTETPPVCFAS